MKFFRSVKRSPHFPQEAIAYGGRFAIAPFSYFTLHHHERNG
ncbi:MAG TPA: hypothetical protein VK203_18640 [Nostocaceae cyanobacterium]|nr:hypothetical protein [Nostocaceae cyanobacterium]